MFAANLTQLLFVYAPERNGYVLLDTGLDPLGDFQRFGFEYPTSKTISPPSTAAL